MMAVHRRVRLCRETLLDGVLRAWARLSEPTAL